MADSVDSDLRAITEAFKLGEPRADRFQPLPNGHTFRLETNTGSYAIRHLAVSFGGSAADPLRQRYEDLLAWQKLLSASGVPVASPVSTVNGAHTYLYEGDPGLLNAWIPAPRLLSAHRWLAGSTPTLATNYEARNVGLRLGKSLAALHKVGWNRYGDVPGPTENPIDWHWLLKTASADSSEFGRRVSAVVPTLKRAEYLVCNGNVGRIGAMVHGDVQATNIVMSADRRSAQLIDFDLNYARYGSPLHEIGSVSDDFLKVDGFRKRAAPATEAVFSASTLEGYLNALNIAGLNLGDFAIAANYTAARDLESRVGFGFQASRAALLRCEFGLAVSAKFAEVGVAHVLPAIPAAAKRSSDLER